MLKNVIRSVVALAMVSIGVLHFANPEPFVRIVPSLLPAPKMLVYVSGVFEIAGGLGLLAAMRQVAVPRPGLVLWTLGSLSRRTKGYTLDDAVIPAMLCTGADYIELLAAL